MFSDGPCYSLGGHQTTPLTNFSHGWSSSRLKLPIIFFRRFRALTVVVLMPCCTRVVVLMPCCTRCSLCVSLVFCTPLGHFFFVLTETGPLDPFRLIFIGERLFCHNFQSLEIVEDILYQCAEAFPSLVVKFSTSKKTRSLDFTRWGGGKIRKIWKIEKLREKTK